MNSSRLPGKILKEVCGKPVLLHIYERISRAQKLNQVVVATTTNSLDDQTEVFCRKNNIPFYRGSENDVLDRVLKTAEHFEADYIVQMTGDCPFADPQIIDQCIELFSFGNYDYFSNRLIPTYPCGVEVQIFPTEVLKRVGQLTQDPTDREHGSFYIYNHPEMFRLGTFKAPDIFCPEKRWVLDYPEDFEFVKQIYNSLYPSNPTFNMYDILALLKDRPELEKINSNRKVIIKNYL